jgi:serine/threonine-protein kinase
MTCRTCGALLADDARRCPSCQTPVSPDDQLTFSQQPTAYSPPVVTGAPTQAAVTAVTTPHTSPSSPSSPRSSSGWLSSADSIDHGRFAPGAVLDGRYRIIGLLGKGGMGEVYRADDLRLGQAVALKFLPDSLRDDPVRLARFHNEVRIARHVSHPNVCRVYDIGESDGHLFLSMEYVDGEDLATSLRRIGRFPEDKATEIARQLCAGLAAAHTNGVLHRDLKPANVMLDGAGKVRLMDFGLASVGTAEDIKAGTPAYMAPEQLLGHEVTIRSDIFALGLVLYELFTGRRAFTARSIADLVNLQQAQTITLPTTIVSGLDPAVERAILSCLAPEPGRRPPSALAVSGALPGGDPLAAALAAGETPSPEMLAAVGRNLGLDRRVAIAIFSAIIAGMIAMTALLIRFTALDVIRPEFSAEVMAQKARDVLAPLGYTERPRDEAFGYAWFDRAADYIRARETMSDRREAITRRPVPLNFWYRRSQSALTGLAFHSDLLVPGTVDLTDPPPIEGGMIQLRLDPQGRLLFLEAMPPQRREASASPPAPIDWAPLFAAAGLSPSTLQPAPPEWNWLAASDTRAAWTGSWPGSNRPLRVEAAALDGKPVAFMAIAPWEQPWRAADAGGSDVIPLLIIGLIACIILAGALLLARHNLRHGRGDRRSALNLARFTIVWMLALWTLEVHPAVSIGLFGNFLVAIATSVFNGVLLWTLYIALEPVVRARWPQALVSTTTLFSGRIRDAVVGRDVLWGIALGVSWALLLSIVAVSAGNSDLGRVPPELLSGLRSTLASFFTNGARAMRTGLAFFMLLFVLRTLLRKQWAAALAFATLFATLDFVGSDQPMVDGPTSFVLMLMIATVVVRFGLLSLAVGVFVTNTLVSMPLSSDLGAWYLTNAALPLGVVLGLATWALHSSTGGRLWQHDTPV